MPTLFNYEKPRLAMIADDTCRVAVHGDNYVRGLIPGTEINWSVMQINHDCYVTITVDYGLPSMIALSAVQSSTQIHRLLFCS